jgi:hypothetical protein
MDGKFGYLTQIQRVRTVTVMNPLDALTPMERSTVLLNYDFTTILQKLILLIYNACHGHDERLRRQSSEKW